MNRKTIATVIVVANIVLAHFVLPAKAGEEQTAADQVNAEKHVIRGKMFLVSPVPPVRDYMSQVQCCIESHCPPRLHPTPMSAHGQSVDEDKSCWMRVKFEISVDGQLAGLQLEKSSGDITLDEAALNAVRKAAPFPHSADGSRKHVSDGHGNIEFTFDFRPEWDDERPFMPQLQRRIKSHWSPPKVDTPVSVRVKFEIAVDGQMSGLQLEQSSGCKAVDEAALEAVRQASPFPHLPHGADSRIKVEFTFDDKPS